jgi:hypothetical protein
MIDEALQVARLRIVQYEMILKPDLIPIQDDPENGAEGTILAGILRLNASTHAERGTTERKYRSASF